ncbi:MAG: hypothetical protein N2315_05295 [Thermanaerothrix sp.]|nr:hypothetical protein [Thermanaerothrix sp.]
MVLDYLVLGLEDDDSLEEKLHGLLERIAVHKRLELPLVGYETQVGPSLRDVLPFFGDVPSSGDGWVRLYGSFSDQGSLAMMVGRSLKGFNLPMGAWYTSPPGPPGGSWGLIGMADQGWIVLFDDSIQEPMKERLSDSIMVAYLPFEILEGNPIEPHMESETVQRIMLRWLLAYLPDREDYDV